MGLAVKKNFINRQTKLHFKIFHILCFKKTLSSWRYYPSIPGLLKGNSCSKLGFFKCSKNLNITEGFWTWLPSNYDVKIKIIIECRNSFLCDTGGAISRGNHTYVCECVFVCVVSVCFKVISTMCVCTRVKRESVCVGAQCHLARQSCCYTIPGTSRAAQRRPTCVKYIFYWYMWTMYIVHIYMNL